MDPVPFGKHRGDHLCDLPVEYLRWLAGFAFCPERRDFVRSVTSESVLRDTAYWTLLNAHDGEHRDLLGDHHPMRSMEDALCWTEAELSQRNPDSKRISRHEIARFRSLRYVEERWPQWRDLAEEELLRRRCCLQCGGRLQPVGWSRANGRDHGDWPERKLHKKCWKELCEDTGAFLEGEEDEE